MEGFKNYVLTVTIAAIFGALIMSVAPTSKGHQKLLKIICGIFLLLVVCTPLRRMRVEIEELNLEKFRQQAQQMEQEAQGKVYDEMAEGIREKVNAYIEDKAAELGAAIEAQVSLQQDLTPWSAELRGNVAAYVRSTLSQMITEDLGIPKERQAWRSW